MAVSEIIKRKKMEVDLQKLKLYEKTMTTDAFYTSWERYLDLETYTRIMSTITNIVSHIILIEIGAMFQIPKFEVKYPEVVIEIPTEEIEKTLWTGYSKGVYGISRYDECYYDPPQLYEALKNLAFYLITQSYNYPTTKLEKDAFASGVEFYRDYVFDILCRVQSLLEFILNNIVCGFWICGVSKLSRPKYMHGRWFTPVKYWSPELKQWTTHYANIQEISHGIVCGRWVCGFARAVTITKPLFRQLYKPYIPNWIRYDVRTQLDRFLLNIAGFKQREYVPFEKSRKTHLYAEKFYLMYDVHGIVYSLISKYETDPFKINTYIRFAYEYIFGRIKKHRPSKASFIALPESSWETYIIEKWKKAGLREDLMRMIIERLRGVAHIVWNRRLMNVY